MERRPICRKFISNESKPYGSRCHEMLTSSLICCENFPIFQFSRQKLKNNIFYQVGFAHSANSQSGKSTSKHELFCFMTLHNGNLL